MLKDKGYVYLIYFPTAYMSLVEILSFCASFWVGFFFLFICPDSELTAGFTYENQLTDALQDIKHIYDKTPDKSLYILYLYCKAGGGGVEEEKRPALA